MNSLVDAFSPSSQDPSLMGQPTAPRNNFLDYLSEIGKFQNGASPNRTDYGQGAGGSVIQAPAAQPNKAAQGALLKGAAAGMAGGGGLAGGLSGALGAL